MGDPITEKLIRIEAMLDVLLQMVKARNAKKRA